MSTTFAPHASAPHPFAPRPFAPRPFAPAPASEPKRRGHRALAGDPYARLSGLRVSRDATIATSRTRADDRPALAYRPLPQSWGDVEELRRVRARRRAAEAW